MSNQTLELDDSALNSFSFIEYIKNVRGCMNSMNKNSDTKIKVPTSTDYYLRIKHILETSLLQENAKASIARDYLLLLILYSMVKNWNNAQYMHQANRGICLYSSHCQNCYLEGWDSNKRNTMQIIVNMTPHVRFITVAHKLNFRRQDRDLSSWIYWVCSAKS